MQRLRDQSVGAQAGDEAAALRGGPQPVREPHRDAPRRRICPLPAATAGAAPGSPLEFVAVSPPTMSGILG